MRNCSKCNAEISGDAKFCIFCGETVSAKDKMKNEELLSSEKSAKKSDEKHGQMTCKTCNASLRDGASFCVSCGQPVESLSKVSTKKSSASESKVITSDKENDKEPAKVDTKTPGKSSPGTTANDKPRKKISEEWSVHTDKEAAIYADEIDLLNLGEGVVSRLDFQDNLDDKQLLVRGKIMCHGCNKLTIFSIETHKGWGSANEPVNCPCGKDIVIGEFWSDEKNEIYLWASSGVGVKDGEEYPLSLEVIKVMHV